MRSCSDEYQLQFVAVDAVDQHPVAFQMDFPVSLPVVCQGVVSVFCGEQVTVLGQRKIVLSIEQVSHQVVG